MATPARLTCSKCGRTMDATKQFYKNYPTMCKECLTMHVDNFDESTYTWILKEMNLPYVPSEWNIIRDRAFAKDPAKMNGKTVLGKYISKMGLKQWNKYTWADNEKIQEEIELTKNQNARQLEKVKELKEEVSQGLKEKLEAGEITEAQYMTLTETSEQNNGIIDSKALQIDDPAVPQGKLLYDESRFIAEDKLPDPGEDLTEEDKIYLAMKWGRLYTPSEWVILEKEYTDMTNSFEIEDADSKSTLILICKVTLKANQALDSGDYESFGRLSRTLDSMRKSTKFTAAQNKEVKEDFLSSIGELVAYCEKNGGKIPRFEIKEPLDRVDTIINDMKKYTYDLVTSDPTISAQVEDYLKKKIILEQSKNKKEATSEEQVKNYQELLDTISAQREKDKAVTESHEFS